MAFFLQKRHLILANFKNFDNIHQVECLFSAYGLHIASISAKIAMGLCFLSQTQPQLRHRKFRSVFLRKLLEKWSFSVFLKDFREFHFLISWIALHFTWNLSNRNRTTKLYQRGWFCLQWRIFRIVLLQAVLTVELFSTNSIIFQSLIPEECPGGPLSSYDMEKCNKILIWAISFAEKL